MSITLEFLIGHPEELAQIMRGGELDALDDPSLVQARVDMSLHIEPSDLDLLSRAIGLFAGSSPKDLRPHLTVLFDDAEGGLLSVSNEWLRYVSAATEPSSRAIAASWANQMGVYHRDPEIVVTEEMVEAVQGLLAISKAALAQEQELLHLWLL